MKSLGQTALDYPAAFFELDTQGCILSVHPFWEKLTGLQSGAVSGKSWLEWICPAELSQIRADWETFLKQPEGLFEAFFSPQAAQSPNDWLKVRIQPSTQGYLGCVENHSQLKQVQQSNFHLKEKLGALFRNSNQMIVMLDRQHRVTEFNHVAAISARQRFFREMEAGEDFTNYVQSDRLDDFYSSFEQALQGQHVFKERVIYAPDGQGVSYEMAYYPIQNPSGEISGVCFTGFNIEAQKQIQQLLLHEQIFVSAILDTSSALILVLDSEGKIVRFNRACEVLSGYSFNEIQGQNFEVLLWPEDRESVFADFKELNKITYPLEYKLALLTRCGEKRSISWTATALMNIDNQVEYLVATGLDMTESEKTALALREQEEILRQVQKLDAIGQLAGEVAHDFNNILAGIQGYAQLLEESQDSTASVRTYAHEIQHIVQKARSLTGQLLIFSGKHRPTPRPVYLSDILIQMQPLFHPLLGENMQLKIEQASDLPAILIEPTHLDQLLMNVIVNARDAMNRQGEIEIQISLRREPAPLFVPLFGARPAGDYVCIQICDTGPGIPPEIREQIFNPFFTTKADGTGLGLAIVYGVVNEYGGFIQIETGPTGTSLQVCFPALPPLALTAAVSKTQSPSNRLGVDCCYLCPAEQAELQAALGSDTQLRIFADFQSWAQASDSAHMLITELKAEILTEIHAYFSSFHASPSSQAPTQPVSILYLSGYEDADLALVDQLAANEDALIRPLNPIRLQRWLKAH